jgi:hypothetical protein
MDFNAEPIFYAPSRVVCSITLINAEVLYKDIPTFAAEDAVFSIALAISAELTANFAAKALYVSVTYCASYISILNARTATVIALAASANSIPEILAIFKVSVVKDITWLVCKPY